MALRATKRPVAVKVQCFLKGPWNPLALDLNFTGGNIFDHYPKIVLARAGRKPRRARGFTF